MASPKGGSARKAFHRRFFLGRDFRAMPTQSRGLLLVLVFLAAWNGAAQTRVLELDGTNSFVELPPNIFDGLAEATVEGWVNWESFGPRDAMFFCFGGENRGMFVANHGSSPQLKFVIYDAQGGRHGPPPENAPEL